MGAPWEDFKPAPSAQTNSVPWEDFQTTPIDRENEASLGIIDRAKYSIEPIQSNRKAFLEKEFGKENILEDKSGDLYLKQEGKFLPLNKSGVSTADFADLAGAIPEMAGGIAGTGVGAVAGLPTGGTASVPLAVTMGATGAGVGSLVRQGVSAMIGNPQVATPEERAIETGTSALIGGGASGVATVAKPYISKAKTGITQWLKGLTGNAADTVSDTASKTISKTVSAADGQIIPEYSKRTAEDVASEVADQSGREMVQAEQKKLADIALRENLPEPSYAQAAQGKAILAENKIMDMPLVGSKIRKQADTQAKLIKNNLEKITGRSIDFDNDVDVVGQTVKEFAETAVAARKKISQELYDYVENEGANAMIGKKAIFNKLRDEAGKFGLINPDGSRAAYDVSTEITEETFNKLQKVIFQGIDALNKNPSPKIRFQAANALVKTLKANANEMKVSNPDGHRRIQTLIKELNNSLEGTLNKEAPKLGEKFRAANHNWKVYKNQDEALKGLIGDTSNEHVVKTIMHSTKNIGELKELIGEKRVKEIGKSYVAEVLWRLNKSGIARADTAKESLRKIAPQVKATLGEAEYAKLMDNLTYLNSTGRPLTISRASLYNLLDNRGEGFKSFAIKMLGTANTVAESKGTTVTKAATEAFTKPAGKVFETTGKVIDKATGNERASGIANLLGDGVERSASSYPVMMSRNVSEKDKEIEKRRRAISGKRSNTTQGAK
jgi:hypothetical protein